MVCLYVTSLEEGAGKTAICTGLGRHLLDSGKKAGFFKPIVAEIKSSPAGAVDSDAAFMKHVFALEEAASYLCPVINDHNTLASRIKEAYAGVSQSKDVVIVEGIWRQRPGGKPIEASYEIVEALNARVIIAKDYSKGLSEAQLASRCEEFGDYFLGVILNKVPVSQVEHVRNEIATQLSRTGVSVLGVLPEDRVLFALTISELAECIQGEILNSAEQSAELVENFMLGAMTVDPGPEYFGRKSNKAVVVRGNRPDMQLAALETATRCLILSGDTPPTPAVLYGAEVKKIPIISTKSDINSAVSNIERALDKSKFNQEKKLLKLTEIMEQHFNFQLVSQGLGLAG